MTRRTDRYRRRREKRELKRQAFLRQYDDFAKVCSRQNLFDAEVDARKNVMWKGSVQRWDIDRLINNEKLFRDLKAGKSMCKGFSKFDINERGKLRHISAVGFYERIVQKCLCQQVLSPVYVKRLVYDNTASQKGKGVDFALDRLTTHLRRYYRRYGNNGYALLIDYKGFFDNIDHEILKQKYRKLLKDEKLVSLIDGFVDAYGKKGLGLGSETSQQHAIFYPNNIDNAILNNPGEKIYFGRYMDDSYILSYSKDILKRLLYRLKKLCNADKILLSAKKTMIIPFKKGIRFLKTRFFLTASGKIIRKACHSAIVRERRRLKKQFGLLKAGKIKLAEIRQSLESWTGSMIRRDARLSVWSMRRLYWRLSQ